MILMIGMKVAQYYNVFNYVPSIPYNNVKYQDRTIVAGIRLIWHQFFLPGNIKDKFGKDIPPDALLMDYL